MLNLKTIFIFLITFVLIGCEQDKKVEEKVEISVIEKTLTDGISHIGVIEPMHSAIILSPSKGFVTDLKAKFGDYVQKNAPLITISDNELMNDLFTTLSEHLLNQKQYADAKNTFEDKTSLLQAGVIAKVEVNNAEIELQRAKITLLKSQMHLQSISKKLNNTNEPIKNLSLEDLTTFFEKIEDRGSVTINSPAEGFFIPANIISLDDQIKPISIGSKVESGIAIGAISDLKHVKITIQVNEFEINQLVLNMPVNIHLVADPKMKFNGRIASIDLFRFNTRLDEPTVYPVTIEAETSEIMNAGARCKITVNSKERKAIMIPIDAIYDIYTSPYVVLKNGTKQTITIGKTHFNEVEVIDGLKKGDIIIKSK